MKRLTGLLVAVAFAGLAMLAFRSANQNRGTAADGTPAVARVLRAGDGSCVIGVHAQHCFGLKLEVHPGAGPAFETTVDVNIEDRWASRVQPGSWLTVVRDRSTPPKVLIDVGAFADPAPAPPGTPRQP
jgi:hypothetical protein